MCQIMLYHQLPTSNTIHKWTLAREVGRFHIGDYGKRTLGRTPSVGPWNRCVKSCFITNCQLLTPFKSGPWLQKWTGSTSVASQMWNPNTRADTKCKALEPMCQIMLYNQLPTSDTFHKWTLAREVGRFHISDCGEQTQGRTPSVRTWNRCVKSCFIINCQLRTPFKSGPWLHKWFG